MKRRLFNVIAAASLVLCLADAALWVRSYWHGSWCTLTHERLDERGYRKTWRRMVSECGAVHLHSAHLQDDGRSPRLLGYVPAEEWSLRVHEDPPEHPTQRWMFTGTLWQFGGFSLHHRENPALWAAATGYQWDTNYMQSDLVIPHWFIVVASSLAPAVWLWSRVRRGRLRERGQCPVCGYDLRETPDRCPECGTVTQGGLEAA